MYLKEGEDNMAVKHIRFIRAAELNREEPDCYWQQEILEGIGEKARAGATQDWNVCVEMFGVDTAKARACYHRTEDPDHDPRGRLLYARDVDMREDLKRLVEERNR